MCCYLGAVLTVITALVLPAVHGQEISCPAGETLTAETITCTRGPPPNFLTGCTPSSQDMLTGTLQTILFEYGSSCNVNDILVPTFFPPTPDTMCTVTALTCVTQGAGGGDTQTTDTNNLILQLIPLLQALGGLGGGNGESAESRQVGGNGGLLDLLTGTGNGGGALLGFLGGAANGNGGSRSR